jgi:tRNA pseudouridine55 synthase
MQGILLVDKPKDWTSFDVVNYARKIVATELGKKPRNVKVGHTGTLDPQATGLLVILVGKEYTQKATELSKVNKTYEVTMKLGETSTTGDSEGEKTTVKTREYTEPEIKDALTAFLGETMQVPPAFSAMKINGQRAYKLARAGKEVKLEARPIHISRIELTDYSHPYIKFTADVSSGTYIRSLVEDIAKKLSTGAYMSDLRRTKAGDFSIENAIDIREKSAHDIAARLQA